MPFFAFFAAPFLRYIPVKIWLIGGAIVLLGIGAWRMSYLSGVVKNFKAAVEVQQNIVTGNKRLVEDLSNADDEIMNDAQKRAEENGSAFMRWLYQQKPPTDGKVPPGYAEKMNGVR